MPRACVPHVSSNRVTSAGAENRTSSHRTLPSGHRARAEGWISTSPPRSDRNAQSSGFLSRPCRSGTPHTTGSGPVSIRLFRDECLIREMGAGDNTRTYRPDVAWADGVTVDEPSAGAIASEATSAVRVPSIGAQSPGTRSGNTINRRPRKFSRRTTTDATAFACSDGRPTFTSVTVATASTIMPTMTTPRYANNSVVPDQRDPCRNKSCTHSQ